MPIDVHAHYVPPHLLDALEARTRDFGLTLQHGPSCQCAIHFDNGPKIRPFFTELVEPFDKRLAAIDATGVTRQVLSSWCDIFGPHLDRTTAARWHRFLNEQLARLCEQHPDRFSMLASVPLPHAEESVAELDHAVRSLGAVGAVIAANVSDVNLGELELDPFWQKALDLNVGVFIHPVQAVPLRRSAKFGLTQIAQYTSDTTMTVGSIIMSGVLDRSCGCCCPTAAVACRISSAASIACTSAWIAPRSPMSRRSRRLLTCGGSTTTRSSTILQSCAGLQNEFRSSASCLAAIIRSRRRISTPLAACEQRDLAGSNLRPCLRRTLGAFSRTSMCRYRGDQMSGRATIVAPK